MIATIKLLGWLLARLPLPVTETLSFLLGGFLYLLPTSRRRILLSNLHHAFPDQPVNWHKRVAIENCRRITEMGLLILALPFLKQQQLERRIRISRNARKTIREWIKMEKPTLLLVPHFTLTEYLPVLPIFFKVSELQAGAIFRPLKNPKLDAWIRRTREKYGLKLLSRKTGFGKAKQILAKNGILGILFDQNAGRSGTLMTYFDRIASTTELPAIMAKRFGAETYIFHPHRNRFWEADIELHKLECSPSEIPQKANDWLQENLTENEDKCADWLWLHDRWKILNLPTERFQLNKHRKIQLPLEKRSLGYRLWIRMPNWLGDVIMALPILQTLSKSRPDAEITLLCLPQYIPLLKFLNVGDHFIGLPTDRSGKKYYNFFRNLRIQYPDTHLILTNSTRGDLEASFIGAPQRFGMVMPRRPRPILTDGYMPTKETINNLRQIHQTRLWENMLRYYGLRTVVNDSPIIKEDIPRDQNKLGFISGSSNNVEKCWSIEEWISLAKRIIINKPQSIINFYGTAKDNKTVSQITKALPADNVIDKTGKTDLKTLAKELASCVSVFGNDTGGIHLANAVGTPVTVMYGPTNPLVTGPFYNAKRTIVQPKGCPKTGGKSINEIDHKLVKVF